MLIVESDTTRAAVWKDPFFDIGCSQFRDETARLIQLTEAIEADEVQVFDLCDGLCESSRDLLFRLHRVTVSELDSLVETFSRASKAIATAKEQILDDKLRRDVEGYLRHIDGRIAILKNYLSPAYSSAVPPLDGSVESRIE
jgi:hypothetical protein